MTEYSNVSVSSNAMNMLKERGDLCSSSESFMHADEDESSTISCLSSSSKESEKNLETAVVVEEGSESSDDGEENKNQEIDNDQWLVDEINTLASPGTVNTSILSDGENDADAFEE